MSTETVELDWRRHLVEDDARAIEIARTMKRIAVLGIKTEERRAKPAYYVPEYLAKTGVEIVPVPVYYPEVTHILGKPVYRRVADVPPPPLDVVDVFRRDHDILPHVDDLVAARPKVVWFQQGIRNDEAAERLARAGIDVVQDFCLLVARRRALR